MTRRLVFGILLIISNNHGCAEECTHIPLKNDEQKIISLRVPGSYCLVSNLIRRPLFDIHAGEFKSFGGDSMIFVGIEEEKWSSSKGGIDLNLLSNSIEARPVNMFGVRGDGFVRNVNVHDGIVRVVGDRGKGISLAFAGLWDDNNRILSPLTRGMEDVSIPGVQELGDSYYVIDNVHVYADGRGIEMGGGRNVIRNSYIEVQSGNAIYMYGPNSILEGNTIVIHEPPKGKFGAAVKIRDADGAVIRNNKIIYKRKIFGQHLVEAAINIFDSKGVVVKDNSIEGFQKLVRPVGKTTLFAQ